MGHTFGIFSKSVGNVTFGKMRSSLVEGAFHPNHPDNPDSPNRPRAEDRYAGYQNPLLGDPGKGQIGRWQTVNLDSLESVIDQMIEQFVRDKNWYAKVRCREALWNMYRRLEWWVNQQIDPQKNDYQRALLMIRDCIYKILKNAEQPDGTHQNVSLPVCPAPYYHHFSGYYLNHYDAIDKEVPTFDMRTLPLSDKFHGLFRYVSSTEDQEWKMVHSVGTNEMAGSENIMKLDVTTLKHGNSSKVTFQWRFKKQGFIRFKYMASTASGDGLLFFINNNQVGGEWNQSNSWQEAKFHVKPGQTYKFDWFVRRMSDRRFGQNAVYVKDVECVEVVQSLDEQTPPDVDTLGDAAYNIPGWEWLIYSDSSKMSTFFSGIVGTSSRRVQRVMDSDCAGDFSFEYRMGTNDLPYTEESLMFFDDTFTSNNESGSGKKGSTVHSTHGWQWSLDGRQSSTEEDNAVITYTVTVGDDCTVDLTGDIQMICPPLEIDHYEERSTYLREPDGFSLSGENKWTWKTIGGVGTGFHMEDPIVTGTGDVTQVIHLEADGWMEFSFFHRLRPSETFSVIVNGEEVLSSLENESAKNVRVPLSQGTNTVTFRIHDTSTEEPLENEYTGEFSYGSSRGKHRTPMGSYIEVDRDWRTDGDSSYTDNDGDENVYKVYLNPGTTFELTEDLALRSLVDESAHENEYTEIFSEDFNSQDHYAKEIRVEDHWEWEDIVTRYNGPGHGGDGVLKVENKDGTTNRLYVEDIDLAEDGYVKFEYGGSFSKYEKLKLYRNGTLIWSGRESTSDPLGTTVIVPLPSGKQTLKWQFEDHDKVKIPERDYKPPTRPDPVVAGEKCYPKGSQTVPIDYSIPTFDPHYIYTPRKAYLYSHSGRIYSEGSTPIGHAMSLDKRGVYRTIHASSVGTAKYTENLKILAGKGTVVQDSYNVPVTWQFSPHKNAKIKTPIHYDSTYVITSQQVPKLGDYSGSLLPTTWYVIFQSVGDERITVNFDYQYYNYEFDNGQNNQSGGKQTYVRRMEGAAQFGKFEDGKLISPESWGWRTTKRNIGSIQNPLNITDWKSATQNTGNPFYIKNRGTYAIAFRFVDAYREDSGLGKNNWPFYMAIKDLKITSNKPHKLTEEYDNTAVEVFVMNAVNGGTISRKIYYTEGKESLERTITVDVPQDKTYSVQYRLYKGESNRGGKYDDGGMFIVSNGNMIETWEDYCLDKLNHFYPKNKSPYEPNTPPSFDEIIPDDSWCWIDTIAIREGKKKPCRDARVRVRIYDDDDNQLISERTYNDFDDIQSIRARIKNDSLEGKNYSIKIKFDSDCDVEARLSNGQYTFEDKFPLKPSSAFVYAFKTTANVPIWMGGCNGSKLHVNMYDENDHLLQSNTLAVSDFYSFSFPNLVKQRNSKVRVEIKTEQRGQISSWTGKKYFSLFRVRSFNATENWSLKAAPFNSRLDFYIDGTLAGSYTNQHGVPVFPVSKGRHTYRWVFTTNGTEDVWDYCEIDFIRLSNWICDKVLVTPYCDPGSGDKCVEALIKCLLAIWKQRPEACVIGKRIWLFT
ncbi:hypothetical protein LOY85_03175 [Brevibacillus brevis]|uniref:hypothetical protein n=1 Tax=Brevibacillus brevis TaxID=1393 RepID=UPI001F1F3B7B|nr:hypothetical protein [Brevibacillus brevis]UIO43170.1 hypothetical protein LOY85_03175 [Brevibacillus brevis]